MSHTRTVTPPHADLQAEVAGRIVRELRRGDSAGGCKLAKVSSLMNAFRTSEGAARLEDVVRTLSGHGIAIDSSWAKESGIRRTGVVQLIARDEPDRLDTTENPSRVRMSVWEPGTVERECAFPPSEPVADGSVAWFDIEPVADRREAPGQGDAEELIHARAQEITSDLVPWCPGLHADMVHDLLREDPHPKVEAYGDDHGPVRAVSVVGAIAREMPGSQGDSDGVSEEVVFQLVEIIVGQGWVVTCWHPSHVIRGAEEEPPETSLLQEPFLSQVRRMWCVDVGDSGRARPSTSSDLGVLLAQALVDTYDSSHRMMEAWMASWEVDFYTSLKRRDKAERLREAAGEISDFLYMTAEIRRRLTAFQHARRSTASRTWFPQASQGGTSSPDSPDDHEAVMSNQVSSAKKGFDDLSGDIRANMDVLMLQSTATQQEATEKVQNTMGWITGVVLVPTLIAGLFGANTRLPGGGSWLGFEMMLALMIVSAVLVYFLIRKVIS